MFNLKELFIEKIPFTLSINIFHKVKILGLVNTQIKELFEFAPLPNLKTLDLSTNLIGWPGCLKIARAMEWKYIVLDKLILHDN